LFAVASQNSSPETYNEATGLLSNFKKHRSERSMDCSIITFNELLFRDVDTVQEFSDILVLDEGGLMDKSAGKRNVVKIVSFNGDFVLNIFLLGDLNVTEHINLSGEFLTNEILDFNSLVVLADVGVDWEMCVSKSHFISVASGDTGDHVSDMGSNGDAAGLLLSSGEPHLELKDFLLLFVETLHDIKAHMFEILLKSTSGALDGEFSVFE